MTRSCPRWSAGCGPDVILIEVEPLGFAVGEVLHRLRAAWPAAHVVVVSADEDIAHAVDAARAGADAWVSKKQGADELETVLRGVCQGHSWFPPEMLGEILRELRDDVRRAREDSDPLDVLSPRERDVLASMAEGKRGRQIAEELLISADTVRTHTRSIFSKLDVHSRLEAVQRRARRGPAAARALADHGRPARRRSRSRRDDRRRAGHDGPARRSAGGHSPATGPAGRCGSPP